MRFNLPSEATALGEYIPLFVDLVGKARWFKRLDYLDAEQRKSPFLWKIVADYHWLEMAIGHQCDLLEKEGRLHAELIDGAAFAALRFAGSVVEVHRALSLKGRHELEGRLRDGLNAETGYAALYLELDRAEQLMAQGYEVQFADMEGLARYDLSVNGDGVFAEVECKSLSADAGRRIHRKDFYRFMESIRPALEAHEAMHRQVVLFITLRSRLPAGVAVQPELRCAVVDMLRDSTATDLSGNYFKLERRAYNDCVSNASTIGPEAHDFDYRKIFGANAHVAGNLSARGGCLIVMRSEQEDDTSKPLLEAMRKAASQFSGSHPSFIALQLNELEPSDLLLPNLRRRLGILSYALFGHYKAHHVNAICVTGFGAVVVKEGELGIPAFAVPNPKPIYPIDLLKAGIFVSAISDADFAAALGASLPAVSISALPL